jgi:site-specific DNA recombinase
MSGDQISRLLARAARLAATLQRRPTERARIIRQLVQQVIVDEQRIIVKVQRGALLRGGDAFGVPGEPRDNTVELTAVVEFKRRGGETKLVLPGLARQHQAPRCDPALIKAIGRGRAWFAELATGHARSLHDLAQRDGISRRYIRRLVNLAFLNPQLVDAILEGRQPVELTATRLTDIDLPLDWTEQQHRLLAS